MGMIIQNSKIFANGGANNFSIIDILWSGTAGSAGTLTLNNNYDNYDLIIFKGYNTNGTTYSSTAFSTNSLELNTNSLLVVDNSTATTDRRVFAKFTEKNKLTITTAESGSQLKEIIGIKLNGGVSDYHEYSTTEQIVGKWIDGSTIYEKTWEFETPISIGYNSWTQSPILSAGIAKIIDVKNMGGSGGNVEVMATIGATYIELQTTRNAYGTESKWLTLCYTKTSSNTRSLNLSKGVEEKPIEEKTEEIKTEEVKKEEKS